MTKVKELLKILKRLLIQKVDEIVIRVISWINDWKTATITGLRVSFKE